MEVRVSGWCWYMHVRLRRFGVWSAVVLVLMVAAGAAAPAQTPRVPEYELDREWPKLPLPNRWITGGLGGMCVDSRDHVYILNRQNVVEADLNAAQLAPPVIEFDPDGIVVQAWGNSDVIGDRLHDCHVDDEQNVWLVAAGTGVVQKYSSDGSSLLFQIGESGVYDSVDGTREGTPLNSDRAQFFLPASIDIDDSTGDIYVADGETPAGNQRVAVIDQSGTFLRQWPLHRVSEESDITPLPHCLRISNDGLVYVCDRQADRIQVFNRTGTFVRNIDVAWPSYAPTGSQRSGTRGTAVVLAFSHDVEQRYLYVLNQNSVQVDMIDRTSGQLVTSFGGGPGRYPGQFTLPHGIAVDSLGRVYVAEQEGRRIQRFLPTR